MLNEYRSKKIVNEEQCQKGRFYKFKYKITIPLNKMIILNPSQIGYVKGSRTADRVWALKTILDT